MQYASAVITVDRTPLAAILVHQELSCPAPGARLIAEAQRYFPPLPIILDSPRIGGFSRSFAHFATTTLPIDKAHSNEAFALGHLSPKSARRSS